MSDFEPIHLRPTAPLAERVLLPGDPGRALALAQLLIEQPKMFNHHRGLWGYSGPASLDGQPLTIQATGMGGPSAAIVLHELIELGVRRAIRVGTCGALDASLKLGELIVAREAIAADGTSAALLGSASAGALGSADAGWAPRAHASPELARRLEAAAAAGELPARLDATVASTDLFYEEAGAEAGAHWREQGAIAIEMEASTLFALGERTGIEVACVLVVSDTFDARGKRTRIGDPELLAVAEVMGRIATASLSA